MCYNILDNGMLREIFELMFLFKVLTYGMFRPCAFFSQCLNLLVLNYICSVKIESLYFKKEFMNNNLKIIFLAFLTVSSRDFLPHVVVSIFHPHLCPSLKVLELGFQFAKILKLKKISFLECETLQNMMLEVQTQIWFPRNRLFLFRFAKAIFRFVLAKFRPKNRRNETKRYFYYI